MNFVYILQSEKNGSYYIGSTSDLDRRLRDHNSGRTESTKLLTPFKLVFKQEFSDITEARRVEMKLKR